MWRYLGVVVAGLAVWWLYGQYASSTPADAEATLAVAAKPTLTTNRPEIIPDHVPSDIVEKGAAPDAVALTDPRAATNRAKSLVHAGRDALARDDLIVARTHFSDALANSASAHERSTLRAELTRIGNETIFSPRLFPDDPLVERYVIKPGDTLAKIAKANKVSADLLAAINSITDKNRIRAGQAIKVIKGPFRVVVEKSTYSLDVYLDTTFVKHFRVGLGADDSTPSGEWGVATKLENPTYYPPRGGKMVAADDPTNPLGERWIGLTGLSDETHNLLRYGIHGTVEPDSIGKSVSLGCIRMYNEDAEALYSYLVEKHSTVTVRQ